MALPAADPNKKADKRTTMELGKVLPKTAEVKNDHLFIGGVDMVELAREQGTALYVFDEEDLRHRMNTFLNAFRSRYENSDVIFASKAFVNKAILQIIDHEGLCLDVSGGGEFAFAQAAGFPAEKVFVHGNNKTWIELEEAITAGAGRIVVDSLAELNRVSEIAAQQGKVQEIYLRITPGVEADTHEYIQTGCEDSKFGFTVLNDWAFTCVKEVLATPHVCLVGLHMHIGSQIFELHSFKEAIKVMVELMARIKTEYGHEITELDVGGGLGVAYTAEDNPSTIDEFAEVITSAVKQRCADHNLTLPRLLCEPGRSLVANAGVTLYTVGTIKNLPGIRKYVAVDGGMTDNIRPALYHADYEPTIANKAAQPRTEIITICGKHCESGDAVVIDMPLQEAEVGDVVCVFATGAYTHTMASNYNGQPRPGIVFVKEGHSRVVTRRETYEDLLVRELV